MTEIKRRIDVAKQAFQNETNLPTNNHLSMKVRKRFAKKFVWNVLTYGCGASTIGKIERRKLEAMEMLSLIHI